MLDDFNLVVIRDAMPANLNVYAGLGASVGPLPDAFAEAALLDLRSLVDIGAGNQLVARFDITESFTGSVNSAIAFGVFSTNEAAVPHAPVHWLARSMAFTTGGYVAGLSVELPIPSTNVIAAQLENGQRYLFLGLQFSIPTINVTFTTGASGTITSATPHGLVIGDEVRFANTGGGLPAELTAGVLYYVVDVASTTQFKVSATAGGSAITYAGAGTGTHRFFAQFKTGRLTARFTINTKQDRRHYPVGYSIA
jgi:hypothetical protein